MNGFSINLDDVNLPYGSFYFPPILPLRFVSCRCWFSKRPLTGLFESSASARPSNQSSIAESQA